MKENYTRWKQKLLDQKQYRLYESISMRLYDRLNDLWLEIRTGGGHEGWRLIRRQVKTLWNDGNYFWSWVLRGQIVLPCFFSKSPRVFTALGIYSVPNRPMSSEGFVLKKEGWLIFMLYWNLQRNLMISCS